MRHQSIFNFDRGDPDTTDLKHIIASAAIVIIACGVAVIFVAGVKPFAQHGSFGFVVLPIVESSHGIAFYLEVTQFAVRHLNTVIIDDFRRVSGNNFTRTARHNITRTVGNEDMHQFGGTDTVQDIQSEFLLPFKVNILG